MAAVQPQQLVRVLGDFEQLGPAVEANWDQLVARSSDVAFMTLEWQREWWRAFGGDRLLLVVAERNGEPSAIAPLFASDGMLFLVGSDGSDYLDFIGELDAVTLATMLQAAARELTEFVGVGLYHVPSRSRTTSLLPQVAEILGLKLFREGGMAAPYADLGDPARVQHLLERRSVRKAEARMRRAGPLALRTATESEYGEWLELFFEQYTARWQVAGEEPVVGEDARTFYRAIIPRGLLGGWLGFAMLEWRDAPAAFDISLRRGERHMSYLSSLDPAIREHSPGKVLQRYLVKAALEAGARVYDLGLGDEEFKLNDASDVDEVGNWFLYP